MTQCLFDHIELLEHQVQSFARNPLDPSPTLCCDVEEMMSVYVSLLHELEKSIKRVSPREAWNQAAVDERLPMYQRYVILGELMRDSVKRLKVAGYKVGGLDEFMRAFILARAGASAAVDAPALQRAVAGVVTVRTLREGADELSGPIVGSGR